MKPEHCAWGRVHFSVRFVPLSSASSVHHLPAVRHVSVSVQPRKKRRGGGWGWEGHGFSPRGIEFVV